MPLPDAKDYALSRSTILTEGYKGLLAVHGAAIAAMLAFASQAALRSQALLQAVFVALAIFAFGLTLALLIPYFRYLNSKAAQARDQLSIAQAGPQPEMPQVPSHVKTASWYAYTACQYLSTVAFLVGTLTVAFVGYTEAEKINLMACSPSTERTSSSGPPSSTHVER